MYICGDDVTYVELKTLYIRNFVKKYQNAAGSFFIKLAKKYQKNRGEILASVPL